MHILFGRDFSPVHINNLGGIPLHFPNMKIDRYRPFAHLDFDATGVVISRFLDAVLKNPERAWAFVSSVYSAKLDLDELKDVLGGGIKPVKVVAYVSKTKNCLVRSVFVDSSHAAKMLLHIHMVKEPSGKWKVFGVEQENV